MGFKSLVNSATGMLKRGASTAWGGLKKGYNTVVNEWAPKAYDWAEDKIGKDAMKVITKGVKKGAANLISGIPIIGEVFDEIFEKKSSSNNGAQTTNNQHQKYADVKKSKTGRMVLQANDNTHWTPSFYGGSFG